MNVPADDDTFDPDRILATLDAHRVDHVLVGGFAARAHGATRPTADIDCVPDTDAGNYERLAAALRELGARLRVGGMTDAEARQLPIVVDARTLRSFGNSTWMTDAGPLDLLVELRDREGGRHAFAELATRAVPHDVGGVVVRLASLEDIVASKEFANRDKDREALPELERLRDERS
jgi:Nucleotidyl transferase AbiEii toxin, Type IV TA system